MRFNTWRSIILLSLTLVLVFSVMDAQAARRSSLAGNQFIDDPDDMFAFPQLMMEYKNRIIIDMEPGDGDAGNGSIVFGDNWVWNFNTGRSDFLNNTATWAYGSGDRDGSVGMNGIPGSNGSPGNTLEWWDLGFATHLGDTPFGFNFSYATDNFKVTPPGVDPTTDVSTYMLSFQAGITLAGIEIAGEFGTGSYTDKTSGLDPVDSGDFDFINYSLLARGKINDFGGQNWRWIAAFTHGANNAKPDDAERLSTNAFRASFGPVWGEKGTWEVAAYLNFDYVDHDFPGAPGEKKITDSFTTFPAYNLAMEYYLNSWLVARGGVASGHSMDKFTQEVPDPGTGQAEVDSRDYDFMWTLGLGVNKGNWGLDIALEEDDVHSGYLPLNGDVSREPIAYLTAWLSW